MGVVVGGVEYPVEQAVAVCVGYAFAAEALDWVADSLVIGTALAEGPGSRLVGRWAFGTYDAVPPDPSRRLHGVDFFIADGLNGRMHARTLASMMAVADGGVRRARAPR